MKNVFIVNDGSALLKRPMMAGVGTLLGGLSVTVGVLLALFTFESVLIESYLFEIWFFGSLLLGVVSLFVGVLNLAHGGRHKVYGGWLLLTGILILSAFLYLFGRFGA